jgi:four helix bundle protein
LDKIKSYKDLLIWQKGIDLTVDVYELIKQFPNEEKYALSQQMKRGAVSIPSNIAEGWGRKTDKSFGYFLSVSRGSLFELQTQLIIASKLNYFGEDALKKIENKIDELGKITNSLMSKLK